MNINQLTSFVQAAELGSLSKAATSLYTVQSAISRQVKALEDELETQLFIRHGRGLKLTESGQKLFSRATHILKEIEEVKSEIISNNAKLSGRVTVGMPPSVASVLIGTLAKRLRKEYPHIKLRFADTFSETLSEWLKRREVDIVVHYDLQESVTLSITPLIEEPLYLIMHPTNPIPTSEDIELNQITDLDFILPSQQYNLRRLIDRTVKAENAKLNVVIDANGLVLLKELVKSNIGSSILPLASVKNELNEGHVKVARITKPSITRKLFLAMPTDRPSSNASLKVSEILREEVIKLVKLGQWEGSLLTSES